MTLVEDMGAKALKVFSDSLLIVSQIKGEFAAKDSKMVIYQGTRICRADALANLGSSSRDISFTSVPIVHLANPAVAMNGGETVATTIECLQDDGDNDPNADHDVAKDKGEATTTNDLDGEEVIVSWAKPFVDYLTNDILLADKAEARRIRFKASRYVLIQGVLFKKSAAGPYLRCLEKDQWKQVLEDLHEGTCGNHSGGRSLSNRALRMGYYWPTMKNDAVRYVTKCDSS
ncbi:uncharacterized protein LOC125498589 [Beta vulgaris subsp. vulgaris]|uniref:uncharacterized protein LOC125498589 n=1 Tax=Beta vulgaris subsp. vulgaris TaxID=3555 RepID=UPI0020375D7D|nr:uncharacterized protein LOC125498589 [Beta vulgaris subsp. vulgaris]